MFCPMTIRPDGGTPLSVERVKVDRRLRVDRASPLAGTTAPYSGRALPTPPEDPRVLYVELFYPFAAGRPEMLQIAPPVDEAGSTQVTIGVVVFHRAVPVIDFRYLSAPATLHLDWNDPWYSRFDNPNLPRHHKYPRMAFLYAEPYEIRHEALVRVRDAAELVGQPHEGRDREGNAGKVGHHRVLQPTARQQRQPVLRGSVPHLQVSPRLAHQGLCNESPGTSLGKRLRQLVQR
jgi:hypothetical protein